ncbi:ATP-binding protein [Bacillus sp. ISL-55]|uniref:ATP-binding protein n=1 Tax=Bacillus sp. ISL-55 TaxID=2819134 RepID=UPI001BED260B|nr:ATP-binding protein [Bacillus sp. ISL-55]MBT2694263.1 GHKL domain-containing protein [Bacillus sp. ISL-55]
MNDQRIFVDYEQFIPRETGFIFKFIKKDNQFIHTFIEGKLIEKVGLCPDKVTGKSLCEFLPPDQAMRKEFFYEKAWNGEQVNYEGSIGDVHYLAILNPVIQNRHTIEVIGTAIDITSEKNREKQVQQMEKLSVVGELAAGIAHEIRNPLTSMKGFAKIVKESVTDQKLIPYLDIMLDEMDRINQIVNEFMFIAKPNENVNFQDTNFSKLIRDCIILMEPQANLKSIKMDYEIDREIILNCDRNQMKQVLINLFQNAIEATEDNGQLISVRLDEVGKESVMVTVMDKGCGIPESRLNRLFEPFYSTKEKGTGLGLLTCKRIIDLHQGSIDIDSQPGEGTTIGIVLPRHKNVETLLIAE